MNKDINAIGIVRQMIADGQVSQEVAEKYFPELKESDDERIRKGLLEHCKNQAKPYIRTGNKCPQIQSWIDWLEKKGEQNYKIIKGKSYLCVKTHNYAGLSLPPSPAGIYQWHFYKPWRS